MFKKLFSLVSPIKEYGAAIWVTKAIHILMLLNYGLVATLGLDPNLYTQLKMRTSQWCKSIDIEQHRMNRNIFAWANEVSLKRKTVKNWNCVVRKHFTDS